MNRAWLTTLLAVGLVRPVTAQNTIVALPPNATLSNSVYDLAGGGVSIGLYSYENQAAKMTFKVEGVSHDDSTPDFLVVSPASGTTPQRVGVRVNPRVLSTMAPRSYRAFVRFSTVDQSPPSSSLVLIALNVRAGDPAKVSSVVNAASLEPVISPGAIVSIFGSFLGPPVLSADYSTLGLFPTVFGNTTVTFNGIAAPLLYVSPNQIDAVVPYEIAGQKAAQVVVSHYRQDSEPFAATVVETSPAIFTQPLNGHGNGILNYRLPAYTPNGPDNPAEPGSAVVLFATGAGVWDTTLPDGAISLFPRPIEAKPVSLTIAGLPATILYAGSSQLRNDRNVAGQRRCAPGRSIRTATHRADDRRSEQCATKRHDCCALDFCQSRQSARGPATTAHGAALS